MISYFTLSNGFRVVLEQNVSKVGHFGVLFEAGTRYENNNEVGLAHFLEHSIFKGTKKRKSFHILNRLDVVGGELNAYTTKEDICIYSSFVNNDIARAIELISDLCFNSIFPVKEIEKEKLVVIDEINSYLDSPSEMIYDEFEEFMFKNHPLGKNILGNTLAVSKITQTSLIEYSQKYFNPSRGVLSIIGNYSTNKIKEILEEFFGTIDFTKNSTQLNTQQHQYEKFEIKKNNANYQSHLMIGNTSYPYQHKNRNTMVLLNNILGGPTLNSRLNLNIREKKGIAYNIESSYIPYRDSGFFSIYLGTDKKNISRCIDLIYLELKKLKEKKLGKIQLNQAKQQLKGQISLSSENYSSQMLGNAKSFQLFNEIDGIDKVFQKIDDITSKQIIDVANEIYDIDNLSTLIYDYKSFI